MKLIERAAIHPILVGAYPVIALLAHNAQEIRFSDGARALLVLITAACILLLLLRWITRNWQEAALACSLMLLLFFSYGHIYSYLRQTEILGLWAGRHRVLLSAWLIFLILGIWLIKRSLDNLPQITAAANIMALVLLIWPSLSLILFQFRNLNLEVESLGDNAQSVPFDVDEDQAFPDIYYIILDGYTRDDVLTDLYGYDNNSFLEQLENLGFYVAKCSRSNYVKTRISLTSSLNLNYLDQIGITDDRTTHLTDRLIIHSRVRRTLERLGYKIFAFETGFYWTEWDDVDFYLSRSNKDTYFASIPEISTGFSSFEVALFKTTMGEAIFDLVALVISNISPTKDIDFDFPQLDTASRLNKYELTRYIIDVVPTLANLQQPKFVFVHLITPHEPYVFDANGEFLSKEVEIKTNGYIGQLSYISEEIIEVVEELVRLSDPPAVIIIQGDHGSDGSYGTPDRLKILNAYYLPNDGTFDLYPSITPVNTFRIIFDKYFGTDYGLVEDISYLSSESELFDFSFIPDDRPGCEETN